MARADVYGAEKSLLYWHGLCLVVRGVSHCIYNVEDLQYCVKDEDQVTSLKSHRDRKLYANVLMTGILDSENDMVVARLMVLEQTPESLKARMCWCILSDAEEMLKLIGKIHEYMPKTLHRLLSHRITLKQLVTLPDATSLSGKKE